MNTRPIIGILAQGVPKDDQKSYIAASYVKAVESSGARVVPIHTYATSEEVKELFSYVNGILLPGGGDKLVTSNYYKNTEQLFDLAVQANKEGDYFPLWATCLGFEAIVIIGKGSKDVLVSNDCVDVDLPLDVTKNAKDSRLFGDMPTKLFNAMVSEKITFNHHKFGFLPEAFESEESLKKLFRVLSTNIDKSGKSFVSTIEAYDYPFYGVQWHPEKNNFEFKENQKCIPHGENAVKLAQYMSNFFVSEAQKSAHRFPSKEVEEEHLIYKHRPIRPDESLPTLKNIEQVYVFNS